MREKLPLALFFLAICLTCYTFGAVTVKFRLFPYGLVEDGVLTFKSAIRKKDETGTAIGVSAQTHDQVSNSRFEFSAEGDSLRSIIVSGGLHQFLEICPEHGCLAVEYDGKGNVVHAYPYRPASFEQADRPESLPFERSGFSFPRDAYPIGVKKYHGGDLIVIFHANSGSSFPYGIGVARVNHDGQALWFRSDYSHHWPTVLDDGRVIVPSADVVSIPVSFKVGTESREFSCAKKQYVDTINVLDGDGVLVRRLNVLDAIANSPFSAVLQHSTDPCDPIHLNYVDLLRTDVEGTSDLFAGDFVVSLRNISSFAILDSDTGQVKRLIRGTFFQQHSVHHLEAAKFVVFDNQGADLERGPSRLVTVDLFKGEETIFPNEATPIDYRENYSRTAGYLDVSKDGKNIIATFSKVGKAIEFRSTDGKVLRTYDHLHDVGSRRKLFPNDWEEGLVLFHLFTVDYDDG